MSTNTVYKLVLSKMHRLCNQKCLKNQIRTLQSRCHFNFDLSRYVLFCAKKWTKPYNIHSIVIYPFSKYNAVLRNMFWRSLHSAYYFYWCDSCYCFVWRNFNLHNNCLCVSHPTHQHIIQAGNIFTKNTACLLERMSQKIIFFHFNLSLPLKGLPKM